MALTTYGDFKTQPPIFHDAFKTENYYPDPPVAQPLLNPRPRIRFITKQRIAKAHTLKGNHATTATQASVLRTGSAETLTPNSLTRNQQESPLFRLPLEIRTMIFKYVCTTNEVIELLSYKPACLAEDLSKTLTISESDAEGTAMDIDKPSTSPTTTNSPFAFLITSRQIHKEAHLLPYASNTFHCTNLYDLGICLRRLTPEQRGAIHAFKLRWYTAECMRWEKYYPGREIKPGKDMFSMLTGLEVLEIGARPEATTEQIKSKSYWGEDRQEKDCKDMERELGMWVNDIEGKGKDGKVVVEVER